jgi:hypothetical protein
MLPKFFSLLLLILTACLPALPEATATRRFTAPTLEPSPTVPIRTSDEIYGNTINDGQNDPTAAALPRDSALPPLDTGNTSETGAMMVDMLLSDGTSLNAYLYQPTREGRGAGILLIGEALDAWGSLPTDLQGAGFTALVVELPANLPAEEMDSLLVSFSENGTVDPSRIAVIGSMAGADMALLGCAIYPLCDGLVLLSPQSRDSLLNVLPNFNPRPMLVIVGRSDELSYPAATGLANNFAEGSQLLEQSSGRGAGLLALNSELNAAIVIWLQGVWEE